MSHHSGVYKMDPVLQKPRRHGMALGWGDQKGFRGGTLGRPLQVKKGEGVYLAHGEQVRQPKVEKEDRGLKRHDIKCRPHIPQGDRHTVQRPPLLPHPRRRRPGRGRPCGVKREGLARCSLQEVLFGIAQTQSTGEKKMKDKSITFAIHFKKTWSPSICVEVMLLKP